MKNLFAQIIILLLFLNIGSVAANDGKTIYTMHCSACHGAEGLGVAGAAPPLAQSEWVTGDPTRMVKILLHGLQGPVSVHGQTYDLVMPLQAALNEKQVADVSNYVRSSWGNSGKIIDKAFVKKVKEASKNQSGMLHAVKLKKTHPFSNKPAKIRHLISETFPYTEDLSTLNELKPTAVEEENSGFLEPSQAGEKGDSFTARWSGSVKTTNAGAYTFSLHTDGQSQLYVNGELVLSRSKDDTAPAASKVKLPKGWAKIELRYSHTKGKDTLCRFFWSGTKFDLKPLHKVNTGKKKKEIVEIISPIGNRANIHRNFFHKEGYRAVGVGFPEKINFTFSVEHLNLESLWQGDFLNVGPTRDGRARGKIALPASKQIIQLGKNEIAFKSFPTAPKEWNSKSEELTLQFKGYEYDANGYPKFFYSIGEAMLTDHFIPSSAGATLKRSIKIENANKPLYLKIASQTSSVSQKEVKVSDSVSIKNLSEEPLQMKDGVSIPLSSTTTLEYTWN